MRIAVWYDYLQTVGGGERVALTLAKHLDADLITTEFDEALPHRAGYSGIRVLSIGGLFLQPPLKQIDATWKFGRARFDGYDFHVFIGNWSHFAAKRHHPNLYYCLTPTRVFYDQHETMMARLDPVSRTAAQLWIRGHRPLDRKAVSRCDRIVAISENVQRRIDRYYGRDSEVIYPPVTTSNFRFQEVGDSWLSVSRLYPEKRIELQLDIFRRLPEQKLILVGGYSAGDRASRYLARLNPPPNVTMLGEIGETTLTDLYARCRGFLTTAVDEDFGITPVEAMAAGKCVLATDEGGYRETLIPGKTGFLLPPDPSRFVEKIRELDDATLHSMKGACIARARTFDESVFLQKMRALIAPQTS